jgi:hypothetical protein
VTEDGALAICEYGGHPKSLPTQALVPVGVDATMDRMQSACVDAGIDGATPKAKCYELPPRHYSVLACGKRRKSSFPLRVRLTMHISVKLTRNESLPRVALFRKRC